MFCYFYFVILHLGPELWWVLCYILVFCCSVGASVCFVCCVFDSVCELFGETIRNVFGCGCYFVAECYGCVYPPYHQYHPSLPPSQIRQK